MTLLSAIGLRKTYQGISVIEDFDLEVERGDFVTLIGPSGCGKSTLFDLLTGFQGLDGGIIEWKGKKISDLSGKAAWMGQSDLLLPWLSILENAMLPLHSRKKADRDRALSLLKKLGLDDFENYLPGQISGGMRQRCALARTILFDRELILLDEPLSALDSLTRQGLQGLLVALQRDFGKTIVMITHDVEEALLTSDRLIILSSSPMTIRETHRLDLKKPRSRDNGHIVELRRDILKTLEGSS